MAERWAKKIEFSRISGPGGRIKERELEVKKIFNEPVRVIHSGKLTGGRNGGPGRRRYLKGGVHEEEVKNERVLFYVLQL